MRHLLLALLGALCLGLLLQQTPLRSATTEPVACVQLPALTGDATTSAGSCSVTNRLHLISTQSVATSANCLNSAACVFWTGLATYSNYFLICAHMQVTTNGAFTMVEYGEGGTPTWETASYRWTGFNTNSTSTTATIANGTTGNAAMGIDISLGGTGSAAIAGLDFHGYISDVTSTTKYKHTQAGAGYNSSSTTEQFLEMSGAYMGDTNAITAVRVVDNNAGTGENFASGSCSLFAVVQ